jgi:hypothetical protein
MTVPRSASSAWPAGGALISQCSHVFIALSPSGTFHAYTYDDRTPIDGDKLLRGYLVVTITDAILALVTVIAI